MSLTTRLSWATGSWMGPMREIGRFWTDFDQLCAWGALRGGQPAAPALAGTSSSRASAVVADNFLIQLVEAISRAFWGLHAQNFAIWMGGIYHMVGLLGGEQQVQRVINRFSKLLPRLKALEVTLTGCLTESATPSNDLLRDFGGEYVWRRGVVYQEMVILIAAGCVT